MDSKELESILNEKFPGAYIKATDLTGGGDHWRVAIHAPQFVGLNLVEQHQLVYKSLGDLMKSTIHALSLDTQIKN